VQYEFDRIEIFLQENMMKNKVIVEEYYQSWIDSNREKARSLLADDLKFRSPRDNFDSAEDFINACWGLSESFNTMEDLHTVFDADGAYIVYRGENFCCGELLKIIDGKVQEIYVTFDPTR
jgi:hypothetical protein